MPSIPSCVEDSTAVSGLIGIDKRPITLTDFQISERVMTASTVYLKYNWWISMHQNTGWMVVLAMIVLAGVGALLRFQPTTLAHLFAGGLAGVFFCIGGALFLVSHLVIRKPTASYGGVRSVRCAEILLRLVWQYQEMRTGCCRVLAEHDSARYTMAVVLKNLEAAQHALHQGRVGDSEFYCDLIREGLNRVAESKRRNGAHLSG